jgi:CCR4-NOT transcription complex subunit 6
MAWHYRKRNLLKELLTHRPDIMCLQEVQSDHFSEYLHPELTKAGYMGIYKKKTTEIFTGSQYTIDGCATFFRCACMKVCGTSVLRFRAALCCVCCTVT